MLKTVNNQLDNYFFCFIKLAFYGNKLGSIFPNLSYSYFSTTCKSSIFCLSSGGNSYLFPSLSITYPFSITSFKI